MVNKSNGVILPLKTRLYVDPPLLTVVTQERNKWMDNNFDKHHMSLEFCAIKGPP